MKDVTRSRAMARSSVVCEAPTRPPAANSPAFEGFVTHSVTKRSNASLVG
jgi:hypothetical protein